MSARWVLGSAFTWPLTLCHACTHTHPGTCTCCLSSLARHCSSPCLTLSGLLTQRSVQKSRAVESLIRYDALTATKDAFKASTPQIVTFVKSVYHMLGALLGGEDYEWLTWPLRIMRVGLLLVVLIVQATYTVFSYFSDQHKRHQTSMRNAFLFCRPIWRHFSASQQRKSMAQRHWMNSALPLCAYRVLMCLPGLGLMLVTHWSQPTRRLEITSRASQT